MAEPKVSVCMPCYNRQDYIGRAIESVLAQDLTDFELLITDNCSEDDTAKIAQEYAARDSRIIFKKNPYNMGVCSNLNSILIDARGQYIKYCFSDDFLAPNCLSASVDIMEKNPSVSLVTSFCQLIGDSNDVRGESCFPGIGLLDGKKCQRDLLLNGNWIGNMSCVMIRRKDLHIGLGNHMWKYWVGDNDMWVRILGIGDLYVVPEILSFIRIHKGQESSIHAIDFRLITERLMLTHTAFWFPHMYGEYTRKEQRDMQYHLLKRLVREGYDKKGGLKTVIKMLRIGFSDLNKRKFTFVLLLIKNFHRMFRKSRRAK